MSHHPSHLSLQGRSPSEPLTIAAAERAAEKSDAAIAELAYAKYESRGRVDGFDQQDWTAASRELNGEPIGQPSSPSLSPSRQPS